MRIKFTATILIAFLFSCSGHKQFPVPVSEKLSVGQFTIDKPFHLAEPKDNADSLQDVIADDLPLELIQMKKLYERKDKKFDLEKMEIYWNDVKQLHGVFSFNGVKQWIKATGFLLEVTGNEKYAEELERIQYNPNYIAGKMGSDELCPILESYIFTRNNDFFHVNLFANASVQFEHTLLGQVKISQETDYPFSGDVFLKINTAEKRFMEIFVRIPEWAKEATVTVKGVKYIAPPGSYCQVAKSWNDSDLVKIHFPVVQMPAYLKEYKQD